MEELPDKLKQVIAGPGEEDIFVGTKKALKKSRRKGKIKGRGKVDLVVRKNIKFKEIETVDGRPSSLLPNKDTNRNFILRGPREFFKSILGGFVKPVEPIVKGVEKAKGGYTKKAKAKYDQYFSVGPKSGEFGTGAAGALYGFALPTDEKIFGVDVPESDGGIIERMSRAALGFMMGFGGVKLAKKTQVPDFIKEGRAKKLGSR